VARATRRKLPFFFPPEMAEPDLGGTLRWLYPGMDASTVRVLERVAALGGRGRESGEAMGHA
jgi:hypothetical protein